MVQSWGFTQSFDAPLWSISAEWAAYLLFPLLLIPTMSRKPKLGWLSGLISAAILALLCALPSDLVHRAMPQGLLHLPDNFVLPVFRCVAEFVLGILAFRLATSPFAERIASSRWPATVVLLVTLVLMTIPRTDLAIVLLFPILIVSLASGTSLLGQALASPAAEVMGLLSYSIYVSHYLLIGFLNWIHARAEASGLAHPQIYAGAIGVVLTFCLSLAAYRMIEIPGRRWLRELFEGARSQKSVLRAGQPSSKAGSGP
jgi:peptidoglycan/LPS O-acetylase OafA/YrhL